MTMKRYIYILFAGALLSLTSCVVDNTFSEQNVYVPNADRGLKIIGSVEDFDKVDVGTRAEKVGFSDSHISEMTMFIFKENGDMIQGYNANQELVSSAVNIRKSTPTFLIDTSKYDGTGIITSMDVGVDIRYYDNNEDDLGACSIYIVANAYHFLQPYIDGNNENGEIKSLDDLNNVLLNIDATLSMPKDANDNYIGFPMIGTHEGTFDLAYNTTTSNNDVANIPMKKIYSKILFSMQVNANQVVADGPTPKFTIDRAEVYNVPNKVRMGAYTNDYIDNVGDNYQFAYVDGDPETDTDKPFVLSGADFTNRTIYHTTSKEIAMGKDSPDLIEFGFYMPEHRVTPKSSFGYPANIPDDLKQYYKPKGVEGQKATFVRIYGSYTDHNGLIKKVSFDIYLGQDNTDDFEIRRNQQLTNKLIITGLTNHKGAYGDNQTNVSVDHRVTVSDQGYNLYMEREAILDAHFEVRPIDIELQSGSSIQIVIPTEAQKWMALEGDDVARSGVNSSLYIDNDNIRRGVRKYFTTNLVSELNTANGGTILLQHSSCNGGSSKDTEYYRVWFYFDENPNVYDQNLAKDTSNSVGTGNNAYTVSDKLYRMAPVNFYYSGNATDTPNTQGTPVQVVNFQQWNLWRVWDKAGTRYYDIEHEEEYLNNYASNAGYGPKQNGMAWGLDGLQLSDTVEAFEQNSSWDLWIIDDIIDAIVNGNITNKPYYDFYNTQEEAKACGLDGTDGSNDTQRQYFPYNGYEFCKKIITKANASSNANHHIKELWLSASPKSAVEYCYNKNKRNENGIVDDANLKWYLPAIDEIQDIASQCYGEFDGVFQKNFYWSSQPAYQLANWQYRGWFSTYSGRLFYDNKTYARATRAIIDTNGDFTYEPSGMTASNESWILYRDDVPNITPATSVTTDLGYKSRTAVADYCRIRAVYRSGTGTRPTN